MKTWDNDSEESAGKRGRKLGAGLFTAAVLLLVPALAVWSCGPWTSAGGRAASEAPAPPPAADLPRVLVFDLPAWEEAKMQASQPGAPAGPAAGHVEGRLSAWTRWTGHQVVFYR